MSAATAPTGGQEAEDAASFDDPFANTTALIGLNADDRRYLVGRCTRRSFDTGQIVMLEGERADSVLMLTSGRLKVSTYSSAGAEFILATVVPGDTVGELGMLSGVPRSATVTATTPSTALTLARSVIMDLLAEQPTLAMAMLQQLADKVRQVTDKAADLVFLNLNQRVAKFLLEHAHDTSSCEVRVTQEQLAASIGASRQRVNVCLQHFQHEGWVAIRSKVIEVRDTESLGRVVHPALA
jgi:CRP-like cAMP-binding protein